MTYSNLLDPTRLFNVSFRTLTEQAKVDSQVVLTVNEPVQNQAFELIFDRNSKTQFFDLEEVPVELQTQAQRDKLQSLTISEKLRRQVNIWRGAQDFSAITRGLRRDVD